MPSKLPDHGSSPTAKRSEMSQAPNATSRGYWLTNRRREICTIHGSSKIIDHFDANPKLRLMRAPRGGRRATVLIEHAGRGLQQPGRAGGMSTTRGAGQVMSVWELVGWWR